MEEHERTLRTRLVQGLSALPGVRVLRIWSDSAEPTGVVPFTVAGADPGLVAAALSAEHGIGLRDGRFCAHPLLARLGVPGGALRASVGVGSTVADVDRFLSALATHLSSGARAARPRRRLRSRCGLSPSGRLSGVLMGADAASAFLIGRLAQEGRTPRALLRAATRGVWRGSGVHVFAVAGDRLWLVQPRLLGEPAIASVPLSEVAGASVRPGRPPQVELRLGGRPVRYTVLDDAATAEEFVAALTG